MKLNPIYIIISEEVARAVAQGVNLPPVFSIRLAPEQFQQMMEDGLYVGETRLPLTTTRISMVVARHRIMVSSDPEAVQ